MSEASPRQIESSGARVVELVVNLDDASGEVVGDAMQTLLNEGALDAWTTPIQMKKQRPGVMLSVLCTPQVQPTLAKRILELTGSFGVRFRAWHRLVLDREHVTAKTRFGDVSIKLGRLESQLLAAQPEFDDVRDLANEAGVPVREVMDAAHAAAEKIRDRSRSHADQEDRPA